MSYFPILFFCTSLIIHKPGTVFAFHRQIPAMRSNFGHTTMMGVSVKKVSPRKSINARTARPKTKTVSNSEPDIIKLILEDHKPLKELIHVLKNSDTDLEERELAFEEFTSLLTIHAKAEEQVLYTFMKEIKDLREEAFEGDVEHGLADQMIEEALLTEDQDLWSARVKVLAELVEHHLKEEEDDMLPDFKKYSEKAERAQLSEQYVQMKAKLEKSEIEMANEEKEEQATHTIQ